MSGESFEMLSNLIEEQEVQLKIDNKYNVYNSDEEQEMARRRVLGDIRAVKMNPADAPDQAPQLDLFIPEKRYHIFGPDIKLKMFVPDVMCDCQLKVYLEADQELIMPIIQMHLCQQSSRKTYLHNNTCRFCFYLMNVPETGFVALACRNILEAQLASPLVTWLPTAQDILTVLVNFGTTLEALCPQGCNISLSSVGPSMHQKPSKRSLDSSSAQYLLDFLQKAFQWYSSQSDQKMWTASDLDTIMGALLRFSLDKKLGRPVTLVVGAIIDCYKENWDVVRITSQIMHWPEHHHNLLNQLTMIGNHVRARELGQHAGMKMIKHFLGVPREIEGSCKVYANIVDELLLCFEEASLPRSSEENYLRLSLLRVALVVIGAPPYPPTWKVSLENLGSYLGNVVRELRRSHSDASLGLLANHVHTMTEAMAADIIDTSHDSQGM